MGKKSTTRSAILLISCPDQRGLVNAVSGFINEYNGNIIELEQYVDTEENIFFMRVQWDLDTFGIPADIVSSKFELIAARFSMRWNLYFSDETPRMAVLVSKHSHCMLDILSRVQADEWNVSLPLIISNHPDMQDFAQNLGITYLVYDINTGNKKEQEKAILAKLNDYKIDFIVLARYMQILSEVFVNQYPTRIINIHHSFLPAFPGARPYHSAHARGVKVIGATSHYVTSDLDAGPIIEQDVTHVTHNDSVDDLIHKGKDLEKMVMARAIWKHLQRKVLVHGNRTVVFD